MKYQDYTIHHGSSWEPAVLVTENDTAKDCTDYECTLIIKEENSRTAPLILSKAITWSLQSGGRGKFSVSNTQTAALKIQSYYYEVILHKTSYEKPLQKGKLVINPALGLT